MKDEVARRWIIGCLRAQDIGEQLTPAEHDQLIKFVDQGVLGMDGFKYCWPEVAKQSYAFLLRSGVVCSERKAS